MAAPRLSPRPFKFQVEMVRKIDRWAAARETTASEVLRFALQQCDFGAMHGTADATKSVRLTKEDRALLKRVAREKNTTAAEVLRFAVAQLPDKPPRRRR